MLENGTSILISHEISIFDMKCDLCSAELEENFLEKKKGTIVKINKNGKNKLYNICPNCQRQLGNKLKEELSKK